MSIRMLAREYYQTQQEVERLQRQLAQAPWRERPAIEETLRQARSQRDHLRRVLDGCIGRTK
jgi:hypothetical protein